MNAELLAEARNLIAEDERLATAASFPPVGLYGDAEWGAAAIGAAGEHGVGVNLGVIGGWVVARTTIAGGRYADHIARHDPARVLRAVAAKRRVVDAYAETMAIVAAAENADPDDEDGGLDEANYAAEVAREIALREAVEAIVAEYEPA